MSKTAGDSAITLAQFQDNYNSGIYDEAEIVYLGMTSSGARLLIRRRIPNTRKFSNQTLLITDLVFPTMDVKSRAGFVIVTDGSSQASIVNPGDANGPTNGVATFSQTVGWNGSKWDRLRTPNVFKTADASAAGNTTIWTPAAGKKFRLMRLLLTVDGAAILTVAGSELITFTDSGTAIGVGFRVALAAAAVTSDTDVVIPYDMGNGYLSTTADNVLQINLGTALAAGNIRVSVMGTEE